MHTLIIAEAGVNHNGDLNLAKKLIDVAAEAGADYVKFQTFKAEKLVSKSAQKAEYQKKNMDSSDNSQFEMLKKLELSKEDHLKLIAYCNQVQIKFLSTPFDEESSVMLNDLGIDLFKIPSGEITNLPFLQKLGSYNKPIIISTGMSCMGEIEAALNILIEAGTPKDKITVLHCNTEYPTPMTDVNLNAMLSIRDGLHVKVGYSDHTEGIEVPIAAVAMGACVIEKHFTLDKTMPGPDHKASLEPEELKAMIKSIRNVEKAFGDGVKSPSMSERKNISIVRKSIHLNTTLKSGDKITIEHLIMKRPGNGISPMYVSNVLGKVAKRNIESGSMLTYSDFE